MTRWSRRGLFLLAGVALVGGLRHARASGAVCWALGHAWEVRQGPGRLWAECRRCGEVGWDERES